MAAPRGRADVAFFAEIDRIQRLAAQRLERALPESLSATGLEVLNRLAITAQPPTPQTLSRALRLSKAAMTHTLQKLERQGLVTMTTDPSDARRKQVTLTEPGVAAHRAAIAAIRPRIETIREAFGAHEFEGALPFLVRLSAWLAENP
jgi:DNA-binding MarR family transcriptional regulator